MDPIENKCWCTCSLLSLAAALITFAISQFFELQFGNSKLVVSIIMVIMAIGLSIVVLRTEFIRAIIDPINNHRFRWILKVVVEFIILVFVTMLIVLMKYPRFRVPDKLEDRIISAIRAYCQNPIFPDPQIKAICSNLPEAQKSEHADRMGFFSAAAFSLYILSTSMLLKLPEECGLFYMCLELTMNAAVEIPGIGGSILNWYYVGPTAFYCFLLIIIRCCYHSSESDEVRRRGRNGANHHDNNDATGFMVESQPTIGVGVKLPPTTGVKVELHDEENQQGGGHDAAEGGGGGRETGDQGHRTDFGSAGSGSEIASPDEGDEDDDDDNDNDNDNDGSKLVGDKSRQPELELNQQGDGDDDAEGGGGETGDRGLRTDLDSTGTGWEIVSAEEGDEHKADERDEVKSSGEIERISSTSNVHWGKEITKKTQVVPVQRGLLNHNTGSYVLIVVVAVLCIISLSYYFSVVKFYFIVNLIIISIVAGGEPWITCSERCFGWCRTIFEFSLRFGTRILRQLGCVLDQEGDNHDGAEGGGGGRKTGDQGHSAGSGGDIVSAEEADEHKAERAEGTSSDYENERISSTSNVFRERVITRRKRAVPSDLEKFPAIKDDIISDRKSAATGSNFFGKSLKSLSPGKED